MRRLVGTIFLLFYTASVIGLTVDRTEAWIEQHSHGLKNAGPGHGPRIEQTHKYSPHQVQTKLFEDGSVLVSPFVRSLRPPDTERHLTHLLAGFVADRTRGPLSSRAPPDLV